MTLGVSIVLTICDSSCCGQSSADRECHSETRSRSVTNLQFLLIDVEPDVGSGFASNKSIRQLYPKTLLTSEVWLLLHTNPSVSPSGKRHFDGHKIGQKLTAVIT